MINWKKIKDNLPSHVKIRSKTYEILWTESFKDGATFGETRFDKRQIVLLKNMTPKNTVSTLFHELLHAFSYETEANLTENQVLALEKSMLTLFPIIWDLKDK